jgi:hypothetical protein
LALDVERVLTTQLQFKELDKLQLVSFPVDGVFVLKFANDVGVLALQQVFLDIM